MQYEVFYLKGHLAVLEVDKCTWESEKKKIHKIIDELNDYSTPEDKSPKSALAIKDMSKMSLKDLEITQLKEANQELKDRITAKESEDVVEDIMRLKEKETRFEERVMGRIPLQGAKHLLWDALIKEMPSLEKHLFMVDEHKQAAMDASRRCKSL